jgi:glucosamine--fructose-6-phosphate aminotransferase (isomerizing)
MKDIFLKEILSQPRVLRTILDRYLEDENLLRPVSVAARRKTHDLILLTGMGSSYFALYPTCIYLNERGVPAVMLETSELLHYYRGLISDRVLVVLVSQSGETIEAKRLFDEIGDGTIVMGITNNAKSHVARNSDLPIFLHAGQEDGPASKSYTASLMVLLLCAMALTASLDTQKTQRLYEAVGAMEDWLDQWEGCIDRLADFLGKANHLSLLGRGPSVASAAAGSLILKEVAKTQAEAMSGGQFRHGPLEVASPGFAAFVFAPDGKTKALNLRLARDIARFGGKVVLVGSDAALQQENVFTLTLPALKELYAPLVEIAPLQLLARRMALDKGLQPGKFDKAGKVTLVE